MKVLAIDLILGVAALWLTIAVAGLSLRRKFGFVARFLFPLGAAGGLVLAAAAFSCDAPQIAVLGAGLPGLPFHCRLDALSAFFLMLLGAASFGVSIYASGYFRREPGAAMLACHYHVFLAAMALVLLADDAFLFMVSWEVMALSSYFLVTTDHRHLEIRRAGFLYLLMAHLGAIAILLCFAKLAGDYTFDSMRHLSLASGPATAAFFLALIGFGAKAGLLPLHIWLPEAHPAAPSPVSALMSGVMLKTAIYGLLRVTFDLLHTQTWWWGAVILAIGLATALFGVVFSAVQSDMKRLLAYSSVENIGVILVGIGLSVIFQAFRMGPLAALALIATLYHCLNHAFFKSLLFLCTGSVLHSTGERNLGKLGGLIHGMPWVAWLALVGALAIAGLPPLNGFVSEWLMLQAFLFTPGLPHHYLNMLVPVTAASLVLTAAASGYVMVKFYAVVFLGQPREEKLRQAHDAGWRERIGLAWLAAGCLLLGIFPAEVISRLNLVSNQLTGQTLANSGGWLFLAPISQERASYSPILFLLVTLLAVGLAFYLVRRFYHGRVRREIPWGCGYPENTSRMQDTAEGFGQPIRQVFEPFFEMERQLPSPFDAAPHYLVKTDDHFWKWFYHPIARAALWLSAQAGRIQQGRIVVYLLYNFITLLALLMLIR